MSLEERVLLFRAKKGLTQRQMDVVLGERAGTTHSIESQKHKMHSARRLRFELKMRELEEKENV